MARFSRTGNGIEPPDLLAGARIVRIDEATNAGFASTYSHYHFVVDGQRRHGHAVAELVIDHPRGPALRAALEVKSYQVTVQCCDEELVVENGRAPVGVTEADADEVLGHGAAPLPQRSARAPVDGNRRVRAGNVENAIDHNWGCFGARVSKLIGPPYAQL